MSFHDVQFPPKISYGASGGPRFSTVVVGADSGWEPNRIMRWDSPRLAWQVGHSIRDADQLAALIGFFRARRGKAYGFRFKDWSDYFAGMRFEAGVGLTYLPPEDAQQIAVGDGEETTFQLVKTYASGPTTETRRITRPIASTVRIYVDGVRVMSGWDLDDATGIVTFDVAPSDGDAIAWAGEFDIPARFNTDEMDIAMEGVARGEWSGVEVIEVRE